MTRIVPLALLLGSVAVAAERVELKPAPAPVDNPLKGLVPYAGERADPFPHSMEFETFPLSAVVVGPDECDWKPLEKVLDAAAGRGHQMVLRFYLEYPGKTGVIPEFLVKGGLKVHKYQNTNTQPLPPADVETPDYEDKALRKVLVNFVAAFGKKYDGDPRVGFVTAGLLGTWGEWHTYPKIELFASKTVQTEVMDAYEAAFKTTPVLLRYPANDDTFQKAANAKRKFGYHDDMFAWATLDTGKKDDAWFFLAAMKAAGPDAESKWKTHPIGGEISPLAWGDVFDAKPAKKEIQDFRTCVEGTHASWVLDSGMFGAKPPAERVKRAEEEVRRMGYEFHAPAVTAGAVKDGKLSVNVEVENRGVAPFYYDWKPEYGLLADGKAVKTFAGTGKLTGLLPGDKPRVWADTLDVTGVKAGAYTLGVRVPNLMKTGTPVRFANETQASDGWLSLGAVEIR